MTLSWAGGRCVGLIMLEAAYGHHPYMLFGQDSNFLAMRECVPPNVPVTFRQSRPCHVPVTSPHHIPSRSPHVPVPVISPLVTSLSCLTFQSRPRHAPNGVVATSPYLLARPMFNPPPPCRVPARHVPSRRLPAFFVAICGLFFKAIAAFFFVAGASRPRAAPFVMTPVSVSRPFITSLGQRITSLAYVH